MNPVLLLVDDDEAIRTQMKWALSADYEIVSAEDRAGAVENFKKKKPAVTLLDLGLPPRPADPDEGLATLAELKAVDEMAKVIVISGQGEKKNALEAVAAGAYDFLCKPVDPDELKLLLKRCIYLADLEREYRKAKESQRVTVFEDMLGTSPQMQGVFSFIRKVATTTAPVLLLGESGTGKEMAALAIHRCGPRKDGPFIPINCNAIPENLLESELFGHEKGSFTGATAQRVGLVETANGGTLFLDEIGELPPSIQVKLLRFLQEHRFQRVGGRQELTSDVRVIAATNVDLKAGINQGSFREDLYFRLAVLVISLPPLRERREANIAFVPEALRAINRHPWPGNVRELQNRIKRAVIMADSKRITEKDLELSTGIGFSSTTLKEARENVEREMVQRALKRNLGRISSAASELGISRPTLYELMEKLGISRE
ncbi:MAG: sigma-54-dependent Fis family transcriptional regulator [Verrucomicrobia bacterium]|nr:MAG: sigma-54-dependent Fis family transcriptional regulator [Verrucomicrobiota bacterium]